MAFYVEIVSTQGVWTAPPHPTEVPGTTLYSFHGFIFIIIITIFLIENLPECTFGRVKGKGCLADEVSSQGACTV